MKERVGVLQGIPPGPGQPRAVKNLALHQALRNEATLHWSMEAQTSFLTRYVGRKDTHMNHCASKKCIPEKL